MGYRDSDPYAGSGATVIVPKEILDSILAAQKRILSLLESKENSSSAQIGDFISEEQAKKILGRKSTWFWMMRTNGTLSFSKVGKKVFYRKDEIEKLMIGGMRKSWR